jgi:hypothetical protein
MKKILIKYTYLMSLILLTPSVAYAETILYCQDEIATGIMKQNNTFVQGRFNLQRYTIKFNSNFTEVSGLGKTFLCSQPYSTDINPSVVCKASTGNTFIFNPQTNRYHYSHVWMNGFIDYSVDSSHISVGSCEKF